MTYIPATSFNSYADAGPGVRRPQQLWGGPVHDPSGHADELRGFLRALDRAGREPILRIIASSAKLAGLPQSDLDMLERQRQRRRVPAGPLVAIYEYLPSFQQHVIEGAVNVARAMFETDRLPASWTLPLLDRDEVWVPSEFNVETFARGGVPEDRLEILGGTLDFELFDPETTADAVDLGAPEGCFTFLTNFDFSERKGWCQLIRAWARAFAPTDPVCLVLKVGTLLSNADAVRHRIDSFIASERASAGGLAPIRVLNQPLAATQMPSLYAGADAYVSASRGEGWGRPYMEAMAMGLPTIGSNWSGNLAFMNDETSWLVDGELVDIPADAELFVDLYGGHRWFEPDTDALVAALQDVAGDPEAARAKAATARPDLIERFGPEATVARIDELVTAAYERHADRRLRPVSVVIRAALDGDGALTPAERALAEGLAADGDNVRLRWPLSDPLDVTAPAVTFGWKPELEPLTDGAGIAVVRAGAEPDPDWIRQARRRLDRVWVASDADRARLVGAGLPPGIVEVIGTPDDGRAFAGRAAASLAALRAEGLPTARGLGRAEIEARSHFAVYAPDWAAEAIWSAALDVWLDAFGPDDEVTLALFVDGDADAVGARILSRLAGRDESALPDLALVVPSSSTLLELAASADAVLTDGPACPDARPQLLRRALRIVATDPESVRALAAELRALPDPPR